MLFFRRLFLMLFIMLFIMIPMILSLASCGLSKSSNKNESPSGASDRSEEGGPLISADCIAAWPTYVDANPVGLYEERRNEIETRSGSMYYKTAALQKTTILESDSEHVKIKLVVDDLEPFSIPRTVNVTKTIFKNEFLKGCDPGNPVTINPIPDNLQETPVTRVKMLENKQISIHVGAGTFNCTYRKVQIEQTSVVHLSLQETWITQNSGRFSELKSKSVFNTKNHGVDQTVIRKSELMTRISRIF